MSSLSVYSAATNGRTEVESTGNPSITALVDKIGELRLITYGLVGGALATLYGMLLVAAWINRQCNEQRRLREGHFIAEVSERKRRKEFEALCNISSILTGSGAFGHKVKRYVEELAQVAEADSAVLSMTDDRGQGPLFVASGTVPDSMFPGALITTNGSLVEGKLVDGEAIVIGDYAAEPGTVPDILQAGMNSAALVPIFTEGEARGMAAAFSMEFDHFSAERVKLLTDIVRGVQPPVESAMIEDQRKQTEERIRETARLASIGKLAAGRGARSE